MNGTHSAVDIASDHDFNLSDNEGDDSPEPGLGDYSARFEELISDGEDGEGHGIDEDEDADEEAFVYSGVDSDPSGGYREQLRDVLGPDHEEDELEEEKDASSSPEQGWSAGYLAKLSLAAGALYFLESVVF